MNNLVKKNDRLSEHWGDKMQLKTACLSMPQNLFEERSGCRIGGKQKEELKLWRARDDV